MNAKAKAKAKGHTHIPNTQNKWKMENECQRQLEIIHTHSTCTHTFILSRRYAEKSWARVIERKTTASHAKCSANTWESLALVCRYICSGRIQCGMLSVCSHVWCPKIINAKRYDVSKTIHLMDKPFYIFDQIFAPKTHNASTAHTAHKYGWNARVMAQFSPKIHFASYLYRF